MRFNGRFQIFSADSGGSASFVLNGLFFDETSTFTAADVSVGNEIYDASGHRYIVEVINTTSPLNVDVSDPDSSGTPVSGAASICDTEGNAGIPFPTRVSNGISEYLYNLIMQRVTTLTTQTIDKVQLDITHVKVDENLDSQIDGSRTVFEVGEGKYRPKTLSVSSGGLTQESGVNFSETVPEEGKFSFDTPPTETDKPLLASYSY